MEIKSLDTLEQEFNAHIDTNKPVLDENPKIMINKFKVTLPIQVGNFVSDSQLSS